MIVQVDHTEASSIDVLQVKGQGARKTRERVRWIDTRTLEVQLPGRGPGSPRQIGLKPAVDRMASRLVDRLDETVSSPEWTRAEDPGSIVLQGDLCDFDPCDRPSSS